MSSLKNLLIISALAAVGYTVYLSLQSGNIDPGKALGLAPSWTTGPNVELSNAAPSPTAGGPLAIGGNQPPASASPNGAAGIVAPPVISTTPVGSTASPSTPAPFAAQIAPYQSSLPGSAVAPPAPSPGPTATLGAPMASDAASASAVAQPVAPPASVQALPSSAVQNVAPPSNFPGPTAAVSNSASVADGMLQSKFASFMEAVQKKLDEGKLAEAHKALSALYDNPDLPAEQAKQITDLLDRLAGTVIYSRQHCIEPAYVTQQGDTLDRIAQQYSVPWQLLARINGLMPPDAPEDESLKNQPLPPGRELKVIRGPFEAVVRLDKHELTLLVQDCYAGRFAVGVARDQAGPGGSFSVQDKLPANDPRNPAGGAWIGLGNRLGIHGTNNPQEIGRDNPNGAICVSQRDLQDLYGILSVGSQVTILR